MSSSSGTSKSATAASAPSTPMKKTKIPSILTWNNPIRSGTVLGEILVPLVVLRYGNLFRLALRLTFWAIAITGSLEFASRQYYGSKSGVIASYRPSRYISIHQASLDKYTNRVTGWFSDGLNEVNKLFDAEDLSLSLGAFIVVYSMYILTGYVSISTLLFIATVTAFTVPPLYLQFQAEIDQLIEIAHKEANKHCKNIHSQVQQAAGPHLDVVKKHVGSVAAALGYNRGGVPTIPDEKKAVPVADPKEIPGAAAKAKVDPVSPKVPKVSKEAIPNKEAIIAASEEKIGHFDSVPSLVGNIPLDSKASESVKRKVPATASDHVSAATDASTAEKEPAKQEELL